MLSRSAASTCFRRSFHPVLRESSRRGIATANVENYEDVDVVMDASPELIVQKITQIPDQIMALPQTSSGVNLPLQPQALATTVCATELGLLYALTLRIGETSEERSTDDVPILCL